MISGDYVNIYWVAMSRRRIVESFFLCKRNGEVYPQQILFYSWTASSTWKASWVCLEGERATVHTSHETIELVGEYRVDRVISRHKWSPRSPDLMPLDLYLFR